MIVLLDQKQELWAHGSADMATIGDENPSPGFGLQTPFFVLLSFSAWAVSGTGNADITLYQKIRRDPTGQQDKYRRKFLTFGVTGTGAKPFHDWWTLEEDWHHWLLRGPNQDGPGDLWVPDWTNPDSGTMTWSVRCELAPVTF